MHQFVFDAPENAAFMSRSIHTSVQDTMTLPEINNHLRRNLRNLLLGARSDMKENFDRAINAVPVADLAAEATNDGSPAQSIPEAIPPRARIEAKEKNKTKKTSTRPAHDARRK